MFVLGAVHLLLAWADPVACAMGGFEIQERGQRMIRVHAASRHQTEKTGGGGAKPEAMRCARHSAPLRLLVEDKTLSPPARPRNRSWNTVLKHRDRPAFSAPL